MFINCKKLSSILIILFFKFILYILKGHIMYVFITCKNLPEVPKQTVCLGQAFDKLTLTRKTYQKLAANLCKLADSLIQNVENLQDPTS
jgi:hypothetical protein